MKRRRKSRGRRRRRGEGRGEEKRGRWMRRKRREEGKRRSKNLTALVIEYVTILLRTKHFHNNMRTKKRAIVESESECPCPTNVGEVLYVQYVLLPHSIPDTHMCMLWPIQSPLQHRTSKWST